MADFALWATACETALWPDGTFSSAYSGNRDEAVDAVIDADPVATAVRTMMTKRTQWTGTASVLLGALTDVAGEPIAKSKTWPGDPHVLSGRPRRAAPFLRKVGIAVDLGDRERRRARNRIIRITATMPFASPDHEGNSASAASSPPGEPKFCNGLAQHSLGPLGDGTDAKTSPADASSGPSVRPNPLESRGMDATDAANANHPLQSGPEKTATERWKARL